jgi:UDP-N-acetylmuramoyl-L-alanyl-D-glutamate--2,6-diaminopimelate ligase
VPGGAIARPTLDELRAELGGRAVVLGDPATAVASVTHDTHAVTPGGMYACLRGEHFDGHDFAPAAVRAGATSLLVDHELHHDVAQLVVDDTRVALGPLAAAVHEHPSRELRVVGVTGTNGKTTTTHLLAAILEAAGSPTGVIGTLSGARTTPEAPELQDRLDRFRRAGDRAVVMEVSSHALAMHRVDGTRFAAGVFTNLGVDHLDLHGTVEDYFRAKARLFEPERTAIGVTNLDDAHGRLLFDAAPVEMVGYSRSDASAVEATASHHRFVWRGTELRVPIGGDFNVMNTLAAATTAAVLGIDASEVAAGLAAVRPVPGRFERVEPDEPDGGDVNVIVDYAHTPEGLENVIGAARAVAGGRRVIVVFGCGGDRDRAKRPRMGATAAALADAVFVTSDNPRSEPPLAIIDAVVAGIASEHRGKVTTEPDRAAAIGAAVSSAEPGDVVVVAGKGHETTQTIGDRAIDFDDRVVARRALAYWSASR